MQHRETCPDLNRLRQLLEDRLSPPDQAEIVTHLDSCAACQMHLEELATGREFSTVAVPALRCLSQPREASLVRVLQEIKTEARTTLAQLPADATPWMSTFLQSSPATNLLGRINEYDVTEVLGQGGMGIVVKGYTPGLKRYVAIKVLAPHLAGHALSRQRFAREAEAMARVDHENVVTIHEIGEVNGLPFFVMEFLGGGSLQALADRRGALDFATVIRLGLQLASGLAAAHAKGLIHRDIKPSNIMVAGEDPDASPANVVVKITDFGLAHLADEARLTHTGLVTGTPMYMAPEQALGEKLDARADLFSLGSVLYTLCTGKEPFAGGAAMAVLRNVCETTPTPIRLINPAIPAGLAAIVERLHAKKPAERIATAAEVVQALEMCREEPERIPAAALPAFRPAPSGQRRRSKIAVAILSAMVLALIVWVYSKSWLNSQGTTDSRITVKATLTGHEGPIWGIAFGPDGQSLATGSDDTTVRLWNTQGKQTAVLKEHHGAVFSVAFAHHDGYLASGGGNGILKLWSLKDHKEEASYHHPSGGIRRIAVSPDDKTIAVAGTDQIVELWDVAKKEKRAALRRHGSTVFAIAYAPDGDRLATGDLGGIVIIWDLHRDKEEINFTADELSIRALTFSPDGRRLATTGSGTPTVKLWDLPDTEHPAILTGPEPVQTMAFAPDGRHLATGSRTGMVRLWDVDKRTMVATFLAHKGTVQSLMFSPDGRLLATAGEDRLGKIWDLTALGWQSP